MRGAFNRCRAVLPGMVARRRGLAAETAGHGVTVLCVSPGLVRTRMVEESLLGAPGRWRPQIAAIPPEEYTPAGRVADLLTLRLRERPED